MYCIGYSYIIFQSAHTSYSNCIVGIIRFEMHKDYVYRKQFFRFSATSVKNTLRTNVHLT